VTRLSVTAITSEGKVREHNEDCLGVGDWVRQRPMVRPVLLSMDVWEPVVCLVADGIGGHTHGETASRMAVARMLTKAPEMVTQEDVFRVLVETNVSFYDLMAANSDLRGMGTTVAGVVVLPEQVIGFNVGDSRIYRVRNEYLQILSEDDIFNFSFFSTSERTGLTSHSITQSIGGTIEIFDVKPHMWSRMLNNSERFLICSDGLTDMLDQDDMEACIVGDSEVAVSTLHSQALARGGHDNISIILVDVVGTRKVGIQGGALLGENNER
jgi:serine/threonine protein phosphatase PrpC